MTETKYVPFANRDGSWRVEAITYGNASVYVDRMPRGCAVDLAVEMNANEDTKRNRELDQINADVPERAPTGAN